MAVRLEQIDPALWDFACPDWEERLRDRRSLVPDLPLDEEAAEHSVNVFNTLRLPDVAGRPPMAEAAGDWFRDIVRAIFGSIDETGTRRVGEVFALVPKKNSKTTGGAGIMMTALIENSDPHQEYLIVGPTQAIADLAFSQAAGMIESDKVEHGGEGYLPGRFDVHDHIKTITDLVTGSTLKIKTFDMSVMTGAKPTGVLIDELHVMSKLSYASRVIGQIRGGLLQKDNSFLIIITTQSDEAPAGVFKSELQMARGIRDGRIVGEAASMLPILYEFSEKMQIDPLKPWADPANWYMVTPNLGLSISIDRLRVAFAGASEKGDEEIRRWASQHLNVQIGLALHDDRWGGVDFWEASRDPEFVTLDDLIRRCEVAVVGVDGGGLDDLFGLAVIGREKESRGWLLWIHAWLHPIALVRRKSEAERLQDFVQEGTLNICVRPTDDIIGAANIITKLDDAGLLPTKGAIGLDAFGVSAFVDELAGRGFDPGPGGQVTAIPQGYKLQSAVNGLERKLMDGTCRHAGQELMAWCVSNAKSEQRGNAVLITKQAAGKAKIDPLIAAFNAIILMSANPEATGGGLDDFIAQMKKAS